MDGVVCLKEWVDEWCVWEDGWMEWCVREDGWMEWCVWEDGWMSGVMGEVSNIAI